MKPVIIILIAFVLLIPIPVFAASTISASTEQSTYREGDNVSIIGNISDYDSSAGLLVTYFIRSPLNELATIGSVTPSSDGSFQYSITASGPYWSSSGNYIAESHLGDISSETIIVYTIGTTPEPEPPESERGVGTVIIEEETFTYNDKFTISGTTKETEGVILTAIIRGPNGEKYPNKNTYANNGIFSFIPIDAKLIFKSTGMYTITALTAPPSSDSGKTIQVYYKNGIVTIKDPTPPPEIYCGSGTILKNGICVFPEPTVEPIVEPTVETTVEPTVDPEPDPESKELGIASFVDLSKDPQSYVDRYNNEPSYKKWFDDNYPQYDSIEQAVGLELTIKIPSWIKSIFGLYAQGQISEDELLNAFKYLIDEEILIVK